MAKKVRGEKAEELYGTVRDILAGRARKPIILKDSGEGETLKTYKIGNVIIRIATEGGEGLYYVDEPELTPREELLYAYTLQKLMYELKPEDYQRVGEIIEKMISDSVKTLNLEGKVNINNIKYYINREIFEFGPLSAFIQDDKLEDIKCVGVKQPVIVVHREYGKLGWLKSNLQFDEEFLADFVRRIALKGGRGISTAIPYVDCQLTGIKIKDEKGREKTISMRFAGTIGREITKFSSSFVIRKFPENPLSLAELVASNMLSSLMAAYLWFVAENKRIFFVAGPTGSGKTTLLNAILGVLDERLSYITIEDVFELQLPFFRWTAMTTRRSWTVVESKYEVKLEDLIAMAMRMRPDYLIVGEVRTPEQLIALLLSATTGHGAMTSIHAQDPQALLVRLMTMKIERSALDLLWGCAITQPVKVEGGEMSITRRVTSIAEFAPASQEGVRGGIEIATVFKWDPTSDTFKPDNLDELWYVSPRLKMISETLGISKDKILGDIEEKKAFLEEHKGKKFDMITAEARRIYSAKVERFLKLREGEREKRVVEAG